MGRLLLALDPVSDDESLATQLALATGKPAAEWKRMLVAPKLARIVVGADTQSDAASLKERLEHAGVSAHIVDKDEVQGALEEAFEATFAEPDRADLLFIGGDGRELKVASTSIRFIATGAQIASGQRAYFAVLGLKREPGAVIVRVPGAELGKAVGDVSGDEAILEAFVAFIKQKAPHAFVERGLDKHAGKLAWLEEAGTRDLAHAPVIAAWLARKFPPATATPRAPQAAVAQAQPEPVAAPRRAEVSAPRPAPMKLAPTAEQLARARKNRIIFAAVAVVAAVIIGFAVLHTPKTSEHVLHLHEAWKAPYGVTFTFSQTYDATVEGVGDVGFVVDVDKGGETKSFRIPGRDSALEREAFGVAWKITSHDEGDWVSLEAHR